MAGPDRVVCRACDTAAPIDEPRRGHVPPLLLGRYRMLKRARMGALDAAMELARLGETGLATECRAASSRLAREAAELRVVLDERTGT